jgi:transcriptional regulator with XRE-family HTH domain
MSAEEKAIHTELAETIRRARESKSLTQKQLAKAMRSTQQTVSRFENPKYRGRRLGELVLLAKVLGLQLKIEFI